MPITLGKPFDNSSTGWTSITPQRDTDTTTYPTWASQFGTSYNGNGTRFIFVAPAAEGGVDGNPGTLAAPMLNFDSLPSGADGNPIYHGNGALRSLRSGMPDFICLKGGSTYTNVTVFEYMQISGPTITLDGAGHSSATPIVVANFDWSAIAGGAMPVPNPGTVGPANFNINTAYMRYPSSSSCIATDPNTAPTNWAWMGINFNGTAGSTDSNMGLYYFSYYAVNFLLVEDCGFHDFQYGVNLGEPGILSGGFYIRRNRIYHNTGQGILGCENTDHGAYYEENILWNNGYASGDHGHNFYRGSNGWDNGVNVVSFPDIENGNIFAYVVDNDGGRGGQIVNNNLWVGNPNNMMNIGVQRSGVRALVDSSVVTEAIPAPVTGACNGLQYGGGHPVATGEPRDSSYFQGEYMNLGNATVTNTIFTHNATAAGSCIGSSQLGGREVGAVRLGSGIDGFIATNNITYDSPGWGINEEAQNAVKSFTLTNGGATYTNSTTLTLSNARPSTDYGANKTGTVFTYSGGAYAIQKTFCHMWIETQNRPSSQLNGLFFCTWNLGGGFDPSTQVCCPDLPWNGSYSISTNCGTIYIPFFQVPMNYHSTSPGPKTGSGLTANLVVKGGSVISMDLNSCHEPQFGEYVDTCFNGENYTATEIVKNNGVIGTGDGNFKITINAICSNNVADASNKFYHDTAAPSNPLGTGVWPDPIRTATKYAQTVLGLANFNAFLTNAIALNKSTWNTAPATYKSYTAKAVNDWIRQGFGVTSGIILTPPVLPNGTVGVPYNQTVTAGGGTPPYTYSISAGSLPVGIPSINSSTGAIAGTPTTANTYNFTVQATDSSGGTNPPGTQAYTVVISSPAGGITISPITLPPGTVGTPYPTQNFTATGGVAPYTFTAFGGSLPTGLTLLSTGVLSGTPSAAGTFTFSVQATDSSGGSNPPGTQAYNVTISTSGVGAILLGQSCL